MTKVVIDMTMSLDGFVAGPGDGKEFPLGKNDGERIFDWYFSGKDEYRNPLFHPEPGANLDQVKLMYEESGAFIFGRRTYDITNGWNGAHTGEWRAGVRSHAQASASQDRAEGTLESHLRDRRDCERHRKGAGSGRRRGHQAWRRVA